MARIFLVDDSAGARALLGLRLRDEGHQVEELSNGADAVTKALAQPPDAVVTDLWMPGISGLQLCRLLRAEPATAHVPVVLLTASDDRRSRFWARHAGATAYLTKSEIDRLLEVLRSVERAPTAPHDSGNWPQQSVRDNVQERLSRLLDVSLFDSTMAGEVRALSQKAEDMNELFEGLCTLASDVASYRWLALATPLGPAPAPKESCRLFIHTHQGLAATAEREALDAFDVSPPPERRKGDVHHHPVRVVADARAVETEWSTAPIVLPVGFGDVSMAQMALSPSRRGVSLEDKRLMVTMARELGGPLQMAALVAEARRLASTDTLTGLFNRRAFLEGIERARATSEKPLFPISALLIDVDHFKNVNDTRGHDAGDAVLQGIARILAGMARSSDFVARWGGEEFVVCLTSTADAGARIAAERLRRAIAEARHTLPDGTEHGITASIGLASTDRAEWDIHELVGRADKAMYAAKNRGRNRVETA